MIGKIIRELRIEKGITQSDLSDYLGLTPKMISFYELGERFPPHDIIIKIADYFDVSTDYLLGRSDIKNPEELLSDYNSLSNKSRKELEMTIKEAVSQRILELCKQHNITLNKLSTLAGITQSTLNDVVHGKSNNPTVKTIYYICLGLGIEMKDFFDSDVFHDLTESD